MTVITYNDKDYISLTDMVRNMENGPALIEKWLRNKNTVEFLGIWEEMYNPDFNSPEFEGIKNEAGLNRFILSVKQWVEKTNSKGIIAKAGRYGGTYAHKDIAFEFATWVSPQFKLYLLKEFQRLKEEDNIDTNKKTIQHKTGGIFILQTVKLVGQHIPKISDTLFGVPFAIECPLGGNAMKLRSILRLLQIIV